MDVSFENSFTMDLHEGEIPLTTVGNTHDGSEL